MSHPVVDYSEIIPDALYVGTNMCCAKDAEDEYKALNVYGDVDLQEERTDHHESLKSSLWLPVVDDEAPEQTQLLSGARFIDSIIKMGKCIYIHCMNGHGRGPTIAIAYLIFTGSSVLEARELICEKRPEAHPTDVQMEALEKFAELVADFSDNIEV